jgi:four helix bundle protein
MENKEFEKQLEKRTKVFAISIIKLSSSLPNTPEGRVIRNQLTKSGTSIGANYREANRSEVRRTSKIKSVLQKAKPVKQHIGSKLLKNWIGLKIKKFKLL